MPVFSAAASASFLPSAAAYSFSDSRSSFSAAAYPSRISESSARSLFSFSFASAFAAAQSFFSSSGLIPHLSAFSHSSSCSLFAAASAAAHSESVFSALFLSFSEASSAFPVIFSSERTAGLGCSHEPQTGHGLPSFSSLTEIIPASSPKYLFLISAYSSVFSANSASASRYLSESIFKVFS